MNCSVTLQPWQRIVYLNHSADEIKHHLLYSDENFSDPDDNLITHMDHVKTDIDELDVINIACVVVNASSVNTFSPEVCYFSMGNLRPVSLISFFFIQ